MLASSSCSLVETEMGIICACGPALRQFIGYVKRTGTALPSKSRQYPNEDFVKMRRRINLRDLLWYQAPNLIAGRVLDALPVRTQRTKEDIEETAQRSVLGEWRRKISDIVSSGKSTGNHSMKWPSTGNTDMKISQQESRRIGKKFNQWGFLKNGSPSSSIDTKPPLLNNDKTIQSADRDYELANILADPVKATEDDEIQSYKPTRL